mgnify:FL=1
MKKISVVLFIVFALTATGFASEEEEAQTRPNPLMHQQKVMKGEVRAATTAPGSKAGQLYKEDEEAQTRPNPQMIQNKAQKKQLSNGAASGKAMLSPKKANIKMQGQGKKLKQ